MGNTPGSLAAMVIAVSFAAGLNVYATILTLGLMARLRWVVLPQGLEPIANGWVLGAALVLFLLEFVADKIPAVDLVWNAAQTFVRVPVAGLMAYAATTHLAPSTQVAVTAVGAVVAFLAHGTKFAARTAVSASPEPVSNIVLSGAEDAAAMALTAVATRHPYVIAGIVLVALGLGAWLVKVVFGKVRDGWKGFRGRISTVSRPQLPGSPC